MSEKFEKAEEAAISDSSTVDIERTPDVDTVRWSITVAFIQLPRCGGHEVGLLALRLARPERYVLGACNQQCRQEIGLVHHIQVAYISIGCVIHQTYASRAPSLHPAGCEYSTGRD